MRVIAVALLWLFTCMTVIAADAGLFNLSFLEQHATRTEPVQRAMEQALPRLTRGTRLNGHWAINSSSAASSDLRVVLFRSDALTNANDVTRAFTDSCEISIPFKLIICDASIFEELMHRWGFDRTTNLGNRDWPIDKDVPVRAKSDQEQQDTLLQLVIWVLGHEIGHLTVKSGEQTADVSSLLSEVPARRLTQTTEVLADQHVFHGSGLTDSERQDLSGFLVAALNAELHLKYCPTRDVVQLCNKIPTGVGIIFDYNSVGGLNIDASVPHPEFLIRLIRLLELSQTPQQCQADGICILLNEVLERVKAMNGH